jgi:hypothetical protein
MLVKSTIASARSASPYQNPLELDRGRQEATLDTNLPKRQSVLAALGAVDADRIGMGQLVQLVEPVPVQADDHLQESRQGR